jgi:hypothetical protein
MSNAPFVAAAATVMHEIVGNIKPDQLHARRRAPAVTSARW